MILFPEKKSHHLVALFFVKTVTRQIDFIASMVYLINNNNGYWKSGF